MIMSEVSPILIGKGAEKRYLLPAYGIRHGQRYSGIFLVRGATRSEPRFPKWGLCCYPICLN